MTEVATLVLTASAITLVLQIVSIALIVDTRKKLKNEPEPERPAAPEVSEVKKQREAENRFARKPQQELINRPAPAQPQNVDQVERSLRDINLRLKNAERDQEKERKRIKDTIAPSGPGQGPRKFDHQKPRERDEGFRRNDRQRHDFHQNRNPDAARQQRDDRNIPRNSFEVKDPAPAPQPPVVAAKPIPPAPIAPVVQVSPEPVFETVAASMEQKENLQHGRKVMVKRRILNLEEEKAVGREGSASEGAASSLPVLPAATAPDANRSADVEITRAGEQETSEGSAPISFGR